MKNLYGLLVVASLLSNCATEQRIPAALDARLDSALTAAGVPPLRKAKFTGPVTITVQSGTGNTATTTDNTNAGRKGTAAIGAGATASTKPVAQLWELYTGLAALAFVGGFVVRGKLKIPLPF